VKKNLKVKHIYKALSTYLSTDYPAIYFGAPDNKVYVIYALPYIATDGKSRLEFVIARLEEFLYNYKTESLIDSIPNENGMPPLNSAVEKKDQKIQIIETSKIVNSYLEAEIQLNKIIRELIAKHPFYQ